MRKVFIVTNCDPKRIATSEKNAKNVYLVKEPKPSLTFAHKGTIPYEIAKRTKAKKPGFLIFEAEVSEDTMKAITHAITKEMNGNSPKFLHINKTQLLAHVEPISGGHLEIYERFIQQQQIA